jgi:hypothetical protein
MRTAFTLLPIALLLACADASPRDRAETAGDGELQRRAEPTPSPRSAPRTAKAEEEGLEPLALPQLGLHADAPADAELRDALLGEGLTIHGDGLNVRVELAGQRTPATLAEAKAEADLVGPTGLTETTLADGWALTFESASAVGPAHWVQVRREIEGRPVWCTSTGSSKERQTAALALCISLRS